MSERVLCIDDDPNVLQAYQRSLRKRFDIETATSGAQALKMVKDGAPFSVIVSDMRMPGMDGVHVLAHLKELAPDTTRIMLTGNSDQQTAMEAINEGHIFRFLTKPCPPEALARALSDGIRQYRLVMAEKELLEKTLRGSIEVLTNILSLVNPTAFGRSSRVSRLVKQIARVLQIQDTWQIEIAAMLSQIGCITVPEETMMKVYNGKSLSAEELGMLQAHPQIGHDFINRIPRLESVAEIIAYQEKHFNGSGAPHNQKRGHEIPLGARILKVALDCDKLAESKLSDSDVFREIKCRGEWYDPAVVEALRQVLEDQQSHYEVMYVMIGDLNEKMILAEDVILRNGFLLIAKGQEVSASLRLRLENFQMRGAIQEPIKIFVPRKKTGTAAIQ